MIKSLFFLCIYFLAASVAAQDGSTPGTIPLEAFAQLPTMRQVRISPDGDSVASLRPFNGRAHLVIEKLGDISSRPVVVPPAATTDFEWVHWANNDRLVVAASAQDKRYGVETLETRLVAINKDGTDMEYLIRPTTRKKTGSNRRQPLPPAQIQDDVINWLPDEPNFILVSLDGDQNAANEIRRVDVRDGKFKVIQSDYRGIQNWQTDQNGEPRLGWGYRESKFKVMTRQVEGGWRSATKANWRDAGYFPYGFSTDPDVVYMIGPDENGIQVLRTMNTTSGEFETPLVARDSIDVGGVLTDSLTGFVVGAHITEHQSEFIYFDDDLAAVQRSIDTVRPNMVNRIVSTTRDRRKILILSSSDVDPGVYFYLDRDLGSMEFLFETMPGLPPELMSKVEPMTYTARDGQKIPGYLIVPNGVERSNLKTIVLPHGGPGARDDQSFWFLSQFLASRGYAVFQPNFRGSTGYGRPFQFAGRQEWGGKMQEDITDGVHWLIDEGVANPDKICIVGWSYGGYAAAMGAVQTPGLYQCAASINGVLNLPRLIADDKKYIGGSAWIRHIGLDGERSAKVSPYHQIDKINIPMLIIQAKDDVRVHLDQGKAMARRLRREKKVVEYVEVEFGGHSMNNSPARETILRSLEEFLDDNLGEI